MTSSSWGSVGPRHPCVCYPGWKWPVESGASTWLWCCLGWLTLGPRMVTPPCGFLFTIEGCWQPLCGCVVRTKWEHTWWGQHTGSGGDAVTVGMLLLRLPCLFSSMSPSCFLAAHCSVSGCCPLFHHVCVSFSAGDLYQPFGSLGGGSLQHRAVPWGHWALVNSVNIGVAALVLARSVSTTAEVEAFAPSLISVSFFLFFPPSLISVSAVTLKANSQMLHWWDQIEELWPEHCPRKDRRALWVQQNGQRPWYDLD